MAVEDDEGGRWMALALDEVAEAEGMAEVNEEVAVISCCEPAGLSTDERLEEEKKGRDG